MAVLVDLRVFELLCSRLCHELINPVGAVNNGIELMGELEGGPDPDTLGLVAQSAKAAANRLQFYRVAYGLAGTAGPELSLAEALSLAAGVVTTNRIALEALKDARDGERRLGRPATKLLLNLLLLAAEALPRGGRLGVSVRPGVGGTAFEVRAAGEEARLNDEILGAMADGAAPEALSARTVHAYFTARLSKSFGLRFVIEQTTGLLSFRMSAPEGG